MGKPDAFLRSRAWDESGERPTVGNWILEMPDPSVWLKELMDFSMFWGKKRSDKRI